MTKHGAIEHVHNQSTKKELRINTIEDRATTIILVHLSFVANTTHSTTSNRNVGEQLLAKVSHGISIGLWFQRFLRVKCFPEWNTRTFDIKWYICGLEIGWWDKQYHSTPSSVYTALKFEGLWKHKHFNKVPNWLCDKWPRKIRTKIPTTMNRWKFIPKRQLHRRCLANKEDIYVYTRRGNPRSRSKDPR
jgi:hypothetical protein